MEVVKHRVNRIWKGERVWPGERVEGTEDEKDALLDANLAYVDDELDLDSIESFDELKRDDS